jgi:hypothetical protein
MKNKDYQKLQGTKQKTCFYHFYATRQFTYLTNIKEKEIHNIKKKRERV